MRRFECDYATGAHPKVMEALAATNLEACPGYGEDEHCANAARMIRELCRAPQADVHFLVGGTQTNMTVIAAALRPHQGVISTVMGHINDHETGAVEATGHKVLPVPSEDGKLTAAQIDKLCRDHYSDPSVEHKVQPGMVYLSHPTEMGTVYTKAELEAICQAAHQHHLTVFVDGARMAYGLAASDITLPDLARLCDVFYIGGTKAGALFGEAVVITNDALKSDFRYLIKQRGGMLAKGRLLGVQFEALFTDGLYFEIGRQAIETAQTLRRVLHEHGYRFFLETPTNQQFVILPNEDMARIREHAAIEYWEKYDETHTVVRFCTSWATTQEDIDALAAVL